MIDFLRFTRAGLMAAPLALAPAAAMAEATGYDYEVYVGGAQVADMRIVIDRNGDRYRVSSSLDLVGMASVFSDWRARSETVGSIVGSALLPDWYVNQNFIHGEDRRVDLTFQAGEIASVVAVPVDEDAEDSQAVTPSQRRGAIDPLTAVLAAALSPADCGGDRTLFDGRRLTHVSIDSVSASEAPVTDYGIYSGPAMLCTFTVVRTGGALRDYEANRDEPSQGSVWLAQIGGELAMPVRMEADTNWGAMRTHLVGVVPAGPTD